MALKRTRPALTTPQIMWRVSTALVPGIAVITWQTGAGIWLNLMVACCVGALAEGICVAARESALAARQRLADGSAIVTCALLALALPASTQPAIVAVAAGVAVVIAKHLYGGLGQNLFNPAMVGYAVVLVGYPQALGDADAISGATALDALKHRDGATIAEVWRTGPFGSFGGRASEWRNLAFLAGGVYLCAVRVSHWRIPLAVLCALGAAAALGYDGGSSASLGSPAFHWLSGGTMLGAFFIATDPVTAPATARGQWWFGAAIGALIFVIRSFSAWPDGIAFAVLLGNLAAPAIDRWANRAPAANGQP